MTPATRNLLLAVSSSGRAPAPTAESSTRIGAIDIGSNSIRMIIADVGANGAIRVVDEMKAAPRLGAGVERTRALSGPAMQNALSALARMAALAKQQGCRRIEVVATSAVREASNRQEFLALVREETGLKIRVINGEDEARLSFRSALAHFDLAAGRSVIMDIGGGSLELVLSADGLVDRFISLPFGAIRLTEEFLTDTKGLKGVSRLRKRVRRELAKQLSARHWGRARIITSGGTFTNLASIHLARQGMDTARTIHGTEVPRVDLEHIVDTLASMSPTERALVPGLNKERADIIVAGLAVAAEVVARLEARELVVSAYGIREGILLEAARVTPTIADPGEARERSVKELAERSHYEAPHARHVQKIALQIFDAIGQRIGCLPDERQILADAALLHDIGYHINYEKHHKHSYHLVQHAELLGLTPADQIVVANVARYHRGAAPKKRHENFASLDSALRAKIVRLSAILRVADGFDRGHAGAVDSVRVRWTRRALRLTAIPNPKAVGVRLELWGAARKSKLLSRVADARVEIVAPDGKVVTYEEEDGKAD